MRYFFLILILSGCYSQKKAIKQHGRAVSTYREIGAAYCADEYPSKDSLIKGDSVTVTDTVWGIGETLIDTIRVDNTVTVVKTIQLPGKVITKTIFRTDTLMVQNTALLDRCEIDRRKTVDLLTSETEERKKYHGQAKNRGMIMWGLIALIVLFIGWRIYLLVKPKIK